jgi:hypothetical protein
MTETEVEPFAASIPPADYGPQNPFWPAGVIPSGAEEPGPAGPTNAIAISSVAFNPVTPAQVTMTVTTSPAASAWTIDWGDGGGVKPIAAGTLTATNTYADTTPGKIYTITVVSGADTDKRQIEY